MKLPTLRKGLLIIALAGPLAVAAAAVDGSVRTYTVRSSSMEPTLHCSGGPGCSRLRSDRVLVERFTYRLREPERGDITIITRNVGRRCGGNGAHIKRVIGLEGETVSQVHGVVMINGVRHDEKYLPKDSAPGPDFAPVTVPDGHYFVMGDNRLMSCDSRDFGPIQRADIQGRALVVSAPHLRVP